ncbi:hypothetical protein BGZ54_003128, partial [Gamsiella multidivaricata]
MPTSSPPTALTVTIITTEVSLEPGKQPDIERIVSAGTINRGDLGSTGEAEKDPGSGIIPGTSTRTGIGEPTVEDDKDTPTTTINPSIGVTSRAKVESIQDEIPRISHTDTTATPPKEQPGPASPTLNGDHSSWPEHPRQFLERLKETVSKAELGNLLSKGSDSFHQAVLRIHMESFDFRRDPIDLALRKFLLDFHFPKEAQQIDRVLEAFASRYHACNPHLFRSSEVVYTIAFSLMLLHTDAHNKNVRYKMTKEQYVRQAKSIDGVNTIPADILEVLYDNITYLKFVYAEDDMDVDGQRIAEVQPASSGTWFPRRRTTSNQRTDSYNMIRHGSITNLAPDLSDLIPFRWPYYWKGTVEMVDNVQINNQFTRAPQVSVPGLRQRLHNQQQFTTGTSASSRPETMVHIDGGDLRQDQAMQWGGKEEDEIATDGCAQLKIVKSGVLSRKIDIEHGKKSSVRGWRELGVILSGSQLLFFTDIGWFQQQRAAQIGFNPQAPPEVDGYFAMDLGTGMPPMPQALISTLDSIAVVDSSYQKYPHVFRLVCPNGKQYLFRADSEHEMNDWMSKINYASAFKTAGVRLRNYRVSWAKDVIWIKDEQGRHQLRRRPQHDDATVAAEPLDGRAQLIQVKMKDIDRQVNTCSASLAAELRLARGLEVMIPLQNSTRQKIVQSATVPLCLPVAILAKRILDGISAPVSSRMTEYSRNSLSSAIIMAPSEIQGQVHPDEQDYPASLRQQQHQLSLHPSNFNINDHMDHVKDEYVLDSSRTSQSSNRSTKTNNTRSRLGIPELQRSTSENTLDEQSRVGTIKDADLPMGPMAIQAAIINAARGNHGSLNNSSTMSSPDLNQYPTASHLSPLGRPPSPQQSNNSSTPSSGQQSLLSPESIGNKPTSRS